MNKQLPYFDTASGEKDFRLWLAKNAPPDWKPIEADDIVCLLKSNDEFRLKMQVAYPKLMIALEFDAALTKGHPHYDVTLDAMLRRVFDALVN